MVTHYADHKEHSAPFVLACEDPEETESADASVSFIKKDDILNLIEETDPAETEALTPFPVMICFI